MVQYCGEFGAAAYDPAAHLLTTWRGTARAGPFRRSRSSWRIVHHRHRRRVRRTQHHREQHQQLETQLRAATEKMVELEELVDTGDPNAGSGAGAGGGQGARQEQGQGAGQGAGEGQRPPPDWELQMRAAKAQIDMLLARMNAMDSAWGMGASRRLSMLDRIPSFFPVDNEYRVDNKTEKPVARGRDQGSGLDARNVTQDV
ncbi:hypothetical protein C8R45DRAFT_926891 [Mycena sanguinolenta]|nr:hypothetical protein C8R45DRAFT_926891 [Mycena sanguinolenta]